MSVRKLYRMWTDLPIWAALTEDGDVITDVNCRIGKTS